MKEVRVYLAGPEVFLPDAREQLDAKIELTRAAGLIPVSPGDLTIPETPTKREKGHAISGIDEQLMLSADAIIAKFATPRERRAEWVANPQRVAEVRAAAAERASKTARQVLQRARNACGIGPVSPNSL